MLKMNYEFRRGILFIRLSGTWNDNTSPSIRTSIQDLINYGGIRNIVFNIDGINTIDLNGISFIVNYYHLIKANDGQFLICDKDKNLSMNILGNLIPNINYETEAFNLI